MVLPDAATAPSRARRRVGAALSLDKFAKAKASKYDKRAVLEKRRLLRAKQLKKYARLRKKLEEEGRLGPLAQQQSLAPELDDANVGEQQAAVSQRPPNKEDRRAAGAPATAGRLLAGRQAPAVDSSATGHPLRMKPVRASGKCSRREQEPAGGEVAGVEEGSCRAGQAGPRNAPEDATAGAPPRGAAGKRMRKAKPATTLQRLAAVREHQEQQRSDQLASERHQQDERTSAAEAKEKARRQAKHNFFKRTKRGQPVMKYRIDKVLSSLMEEAVHRGPPQRK